MDYFKESDLEHICNNCGKDHATDWKSKWDEHSPFIHYKIWKCDECGYEISIRTDYDTSGID
ncbi:hypothetical protein ACFLTH_09610 [Bacteroidota bacterium]